MKTADIEISDLAQRVDSPAALAGFVRALLNDLEQGGDSWENATLQRYLEALSRWVEDMDGYYLGRGEPVPEQPSWRTLADILMAATMYE
jgi:hypothetical protein